MDDGIESFHQAGFLSFPSSLTDAVSDLRKQSFEATTVNFRSKFEALRSEVQKWHMSKIDFLEKYTPKKFKNYKSVLTFAEAVTLFNALESSPVTALCQLPKYKFYQADLCFARASVVYMDAVLSKISKDALKKIWMFGNFKAIQPHSEWRYHVATVVFTEQGWMAIDPVLFDKPVSVRDWHLEMMIRVNRFDHEVIPELYISSGSRKTRGKDRKYSDFTDGIEGNVRTYFEDAFKEMRERKGSLRDPDAK